MERWVGYGSRRAEWAAAKHHEAAKQVRLGTPAGCTVGTRAFPCHHGLALLVKALTAAQRSDQKLTQGRQVTLKEMLINAHTVAQCC